MMSIADALKSHLSLYSDSALLDAELLLCHVLSCDRTYLRTWPEKPLTAAEQSQFMSLIKSRKAGQPVAHLLGYRAFWTLDLMVSPDTLIPRPDTEILIEQALALVLPENASVLDLGTGTGAIALALASERLTWKVTASDVFPEVVALAQKNVENHQLQNVKLVCSRWLEKFEHERFHLIVSNPPYIDPIDPHLRQGDLRFEPTSALVAGKHGMADIEHIVEASKEHLFSNGWLMIEHGSKQGEAVRRCFLQQGYRQVRTVRDYGENERMTMGCVE